MNTHRRAKEDFLVFGSPLICDAEIQEVTAIMKTGWLGTGPKVAQFEKDVAAYKGSPHAVALNSCTAALHLSIIAAGVQEGDEVITTPMTFCAMLQMASISQGRPAKCTGRMALVRGVIFDSIRSGSIFIVWGSTSARTGVAPA